MDIQLIRNATVKLTYGGKTFLIDPYLGEKYSQPPFAGISKNPTVELPLSTEAIIAGTDIVLVSHCHPDHFDEAAAQKIPKHMPILCQPEEVGTIASKGFLEVTPLAAPLSMGALTITPTPGQHGHGERLVMMGKVSGYIFQHPDEPTLYWMGDTIWYPEVQSIIGDLRPAVIVTHSCGAIWSKEELPVIMDHKQTVEVCHFAPYANVIATHMEALDLATVSRAQLRNYADAKGVPASKLLIPQDGEVIKLNRKEMEPSEA